jgi:hypothetical protein
MCGLYRGREERDGILLPFLREGLAAGDKCICVVDSEAPAHVADALDMEPTVRASLESHQFALFSSMETYFDTGSFSAERMVAFWTGVLETALTDGYPLVRAIAEGTWALRDLPGVHELLVYESEFGRRTLRYPVLSVCMYDLDRFGGEVLLALMNTHPKILVGGMVHDNPYYIPPQEFLASREPAT